jgi:TRAP-type transport system periplasmic protein
MGGHKMKNKIMFGFAFTAILIFSIVACGKKADQGQAGKAETEVIKLKFSFSGMPTEPPALTATHLLDLVEAKTNGRVKIERFMGGSLGNTLEHLDLVSKGAVDIISLQFDQFPENLPLHQILNTEQLVTGEQAFANIVALTQEIPETKALLEAEEKQNNIKVLSWNAQGSTGITTSYPAQSLNDLKGKKMNVIAGYQRDVFNELGIIPVNVQIPDIYESMSRGVIDTIFMANSAVISLKWYELGKTHLSLGDNNVLSQALTLNLDTWNSLPADIQQIFIDASKETAQWSINEAVKIQEATYQAFEKSGVNIVTLPDEDRTRFFETLFKYSTQNWLDVCKKKGVGDKAPVIQKYWDEMKWGRWSKQ